MYIDCGIATLTLRSCCWPLGLGDVPPFLNIGPPGGGEGVYDIPGGDNPAPPPLTRVLLLQLKSPRVEKDSLRSSPESSKRDDMQRALLLAEASTKFDLVLGISGRDPTILALSLEPLIADRKEHQSPRS